METRGSQGFIGQPVRLTESVRDAASENTVESERENGRADLGLQRVLACSQALPLHLVCVEHNLPTANPCVAICLVPTVC